MRVSVQAGDPGFHPYFERMAETGLPMKVYLEGVEMDFFLTADEERGTISRYVRDRSGGLAVTADNEFQIEVLHGRVTIE